MRALLLCLLLASGAIQAQPYPSRPVRTDGVDAARMGSQELNAFMRAEYEKRGEVVRDTGATVN